MKKWPIAFGVVILLLVGGYFLVLAPAPATAAILYIDRGQVEINIGRGWLSGTDEMELAVGSQIRTGDGEATVVLMEGEVITLLPDSEIKLDEISGSRIKISQLAGETWNKVSKISGISEYTIETPTTVATVRGTEFFISEESLEVIEGEVDFWKRAEPGKKIRIGAMKRAAAAEMAEVAFAEADFTKADRMRENYVKNLKRVREREIRKHATLLKQAKKRGYSEEKLRQTLKDIDEGREDEDKIYDEIPAIMKPKAKRTYMLTKEIKKAKKRR